MDRVLIEKAITLLHDPEDIVEIRSIDPKPAVSGYFKASSQNIYKELARFPERTFYQTLNVINKACFSRSQHEVLRTYPKETTSDNDIIGYQWILIDADPVRPSGVSATDDEKEKARRTAIEVYRHLRNNGFSDPVVADSGNGYHLLYRIQGDVSSKEAIADFLKVLDMWFSSDEVLIDTSVSNPSRITKLYGTIAQKGANTPERPHRTSKILHTPEVLKPTPMSLVRKIAGNIAKLVQPEQPSSGKRSATAFDMDAFLALHHIEVARKVILSDQTRYILAECPFNCEHKAPDAAVFVRQNGALGFKCFHNSCSDYGWHDFRAKIDPLAYSTSVFRTNQMPEIHSISNNPESKVTEDAYQDIAFPDDTKPATAPATRLPVMLDISDVEDYDRSKITTIRSRLTKLDTLIGGFNKGELSIWSGANSSGKSTLVSQLGLEAVHQGYKVAMFSGEMPPKVVKYWLYLQAAGRDQVEPDQLSPRHYRLKEGVKEHLNEVLRGSLAIYNNDYGNNWETVATVIFEWVKEKGADVVIIDNLMALNITSSTSDKYDIQTQIVQALSRTAKQLNVHIHFICHPRKTESFLRKNDISGTSDLSNTADNVFMVHRINTDFMLRVKEVYPKLTIPPDAGNAIEIMKNRDLGVVDEMILLYYDKTCKTMTDIKGGIPGYSWHEKFIQVDPSTIPGFPFKEDAGHGTNHNS